MKKEIEENLESEIQYFRSYDPAGDTVRRDMHDCIMEEIEKYEMGINSHDGLLEAIEDFHSY